MSDLRERVGLELENWLTKHRGRNMYDEAGCVLSLVEQDRAALVEALEKIEHNGCTEDSHVARAALAWVKEMGDE